MIGVFDSGVGGLCALSHLCRLLPHTDILYYADTAHLPFGCREASEICAYTRRALAFFRTAQVDAVLVACGTAGSLALEKCKEDFTFPLFDVITPAAHAACEASHSKRIAVAATAATVKSGAFTRAVQAIAPRAEVLSLACPAFVPLAEEGASAGEQFFAVQKALSPIRDWQADTLILGCTHFPLLRGTIEALFPHLTIIDAAKEGARALAAAVSVPEEEGRVRFFVTEGASRFRERASFVLHTEISEAAVYTC